MNTQNGSGNFSVFGLPGYSDMFTINGTDYLNSYGDNNKSGATNNSLGASEMQSFTVVNNGYSGNYGRLYLLWERPANNKHRLRVPPFDGSIKWRFGDHYHPSEQRSVLHFRNLI
jgi:hypothetical protein